MQSLRELYKIGKGPSSSHTMGVNFASKQFLAKNYDFDDCVVTLFGSLAQTGKGHLSDKAVIDAFNEENKKVKIVFDKKQKQPHPNTLTFTAKKDGNLVASETYFSIGGGSILEKGSEFSKPKEVYPHNSFDEIRKFCIEKDFRICDYVKYIEGDEIVEYLALVWDTMKKCIITGLKTEGKLSGELKIERKAKYLYTQNHIDESAETRENRLVCAYAYAVSEQNAGGGEIVTAPTCGASGVLPAVLYYNYKKRNLSDETIINALATAGIIGNLIKTNASISGAECGCQAEIGSACSMASAGLAEALQMQLDQIEYASEIAMEHHLGLTCDPIGGLVQIPCIERNAVAAMRAINAVSLANFLTKTRKISFDVIVETMYATGKDMDKRYRETAKGGLAKLYK